MTSGAKGVGRFVSKNSPTLFAGASIFGVISTAALAIKATKPALELLDEMKTEKGDCVITRTEIVKATWRFYIPTAISAGLTISAIVFSNTLHLRRNAALVALYSVAEGALDQYQEKVVELMGKNKAEKVKEGVVQDKLDQNPVQTQRVVVTGHGDSLFFDSLSGRYFYSDLETVRKVINDFNQKLFTDMYGTLNEFYFELGLESIVIGRDVGWNIEERPLEVAFTTKIASTGQPCIVLDYRVQPVNL